MCYAYPGPRCTSHAFRQLQAAKEMWSSAKSSSEKTRAMEILQEAQLKYDATIGGQKELKDQIASTGDPNGNLALRLDRGAEDRATSLALIKSKDVGDKEKSEHISHLDGMRNTHIATLDKDPNKDPGRYIDSIAPLEEFRKAAAEGRIDVQYSADPDVPYVTLNYSRETQFKREWDDVTVASRGLIVDTRTGEIVARPFKKFFNDDEPAGDYNTFPRTGPVAVAEKADGSLGILYKKPDGSFALSTRGSMNSEQAAVATAIYNEKYAGKWEGEKDDENTYLFEIIHPQHRIVLDYGDTEDLILLGAVNKSTGKSLPVSQIDSWKGPKVQELPYNSYPQALAHEIPDDQEGVVIHFLDSDNRVKLKGAEYKRLHKLTTGVTTVRLWENLSRGGQKGFNNWVANLPDEFADQVKAKAADLQSKKESIFNSVIQDATRLKTEAQSKGLTSRKDIAMYIQKEAKNDPRKKSLLAAALSSNHSKLHKWAWDQVRPRGKELI